MSRLTPAYAVALLLLAACASPGALPVAGGAQAASAGPVQTVGSLHVEPFEIVYGRRKGKETPLPVRVWQRGFKGQYVADNRCAGVSVTLLKYDPRNASIWSVDAKHARRQDCLVAFSGTGGPRGTNYLRIRILR